MFTETNRRNTKEFWVYLRFIKKCFIVALLLSQKDLRSEMDIKIFHLLKTQNIDKALLEAVRSIK